MFFGIRFFESKYWSKLGYPRKAPRLHLRPQPTCLGHYETKMRPWTTGKVGPTYQTWYSVAFSGKSLNLRWLMPKIQICSSIALASAKIFFQRNQWIRALFCGPAIGFWVKTTRKKLKDLKMRHWPDLWQLLWAKKGLHLRPQVIFGTLQLWIIGSRGIWMLHRNQFCHSKCQR